MRVTRPALCLALAASVVASGAANAAAKKPAPKPVCNLITDDAGDAGVVTGQDGMDILSADVASNAKIVTAVIRLKAAPKQSNPEAPGGTIYYLKFLAPGSDNPQYFTASVPFSGAITYATGEVTTTGGQHVSNDDAAGSAVGSIKGSILTITAPVNGFSRVSLKPGQKLSELTAEVRVLIGAAGTGSLVLADDAAGVKPYVAGALSCVKP